MSSDARRMRRNRERRATRAAMRAVRARGCRCEFVGKWRIDYDEELELSMRSFGVGLRWNDGMAEAWLLHAELCPADITAVDADTGQLRTIIYRDDGSVYMGAIRRPVDDRDRPA